MPEPTPQRPFLLCAGTHADVAARLAESACALLAAREATVLATWREPPVTGPIDAVGDALYDTHHDLRDAAREAAEDVAGAAVDALQARGVRVATRTICDERPPWQAILELADELDCGVIVAGTTQGLEPHPGSIGREARALAHRSRRPLLLLPPDCEKPPAGARALLAYDGSPAAEHAVDVASRVLARRPALVSTVWMPASHVVGLALLAVPGDVARGGADRLDEATRRGAAARAADGAARLDGAGWQASGEALEGEHNAAAAIIGAADECDAAVVVTGTRGRSRVAAALLGSTAEAVVRFAGRPVLLVPPATAS